VQTKKKHCQTLWIEQADALLVFIELYDSVTVALHNLSVECDSNTASSACQLTAAIMNFTFLVLLSTASNLLSYTKPLSVFLQKSGLDMCEAMAKVKSLENILMNHRLNADERFNAVYKVATDIAEKYAVEPSIPRVCSKQTGRSNVDCVSIEAYFRATVYIPFIDQLIQGLTERFGKTQQQVALASKLVPSVMVGSTPMTLAES
jgi:hypothetical protein